MEEQKADVVFATGGTAGHVFPAVAVGNELKNRELKSHFITASHGIQSDLQAEASKNDKSIQSNVSYLNVSGFSKSILSLKNIHSALEALRAKGKAKKLLQSIQPSVVLSTGGYAAVPTGLAARALKIPFVVFEPNAIPGRASRFLSRKAAVSAVGFKECKLPRSFHSGIPVHEKILAIDRAKNQDKTKQKLGYEKEAELLVVVGGSLGSMNINQLVLASAKELLKRESLYIHHIVGKRDWEQHQQSEDFKVLKNDTPQNPKKYHAVEFEDNMAPLFEAADLFVSRAGASTIAELDASATPAILIPWSKAVSNHQVANAKAYCADSANGSQVLDEKTLSTDTFVSGVLNFLNSPLIHSANSKHRHATSALADLLQQYCV